MEDMITIDDSGQYCVRTQKCKAPGKPSKDVNTVLEVCIGDLKLKPRDMEQAKLTLALMAEGEDELPFVVATGPAGTGKTTYGTACLLSKEKRLAAEHGRAPRDFVVCRPAVEAEEEIGFLKGGLFEKIAPYFQPVFDVLKSAWSGLFKKAEPVETKGAVYMEIQGFQFEVAPIAFMRGRTFKNTVIVVDEAQNLTVGQMKMVLSRLGEGSTMYLCGDLSQTDLPDDKPSGLKHFLDKVLPRIEAKAEKQGQRCNFYHAKLQQQYRHEWVGQVVDAYADLEAEG